MVSRDTTGAAAWTGTATTRRTEVLSEVADAGRRLAVVVVVVVVWDEPLFEDEDPEDEPLVKEVLTVLRMKGVS